MGVRFSLLILIPRILVVESHYQKGGVDYNYIWVGIVAMSSNFAYLIPQKSRIIEKLIISGCIGLILIILQNLFLTPFLIESIYEDKTWLLWNGQPRLIVNSFHYLFELFIFIAFCELWFRKNYLQHSS